MDILESFAICEAPHSLEGGANAFEFVCPLYKNEVVLHSKAWIGCFLEHWCIAAFAIGSICGDSNLCSRAVIHCLAGDGSSLHYVSTQKNHWLSDETCWTAAPVISFKQLAHINCNYSSLCMISLCWLA